MDQESIETARGEEGAEEKEAHIEDDCVRRLLEERARSPACRVPKGQAPVKTFPGEQMHKIEQCGLGEL
eukprot:580119-Hanusia_phi.AAC.2